MSDEKIDSRINIEDLPQAEQELTTEEAREVTAGVGTTVETGAALHLKPAKVDY